MHLLPDALEARVVLHGVETRGERGGRQIGKADDGVGKAVRIGCLLHPGDFLDRTARLPIGLHIDRGDDA